MIKDDEQANLYEYRVNVLNDKILKVQEKNNQLAQEVAKLKQHKSNMNSELQSYYAKVAYYEELTSKQAVLSDGNNNDNQILIKGTDDDNSENSSSNDLDDQKLVYTALKNRLAEIERSLGEVELGVPHKKQPVEDLMQFQCVCVMFQDSDSVESGSNVYKYQTFRISKNTTISELKEKCLILWDQIEKREDYRLYLLEKEPLKAEEDGDCIHEIFKKYNNQFKKAKFILAQKAPKKEEINQDQKDGDVLGDMAKKNSTQKFDDFAANFVGVADFIKTKYFQIKEELQKKKKEVKVTHRWVPVVLYMILFAVFIAFTLYALTQMRDPNKSFIMVSALHRKFNTETKDYLEEMSEVSIDISKKLKEFFYDEISSEDVSGANVFINSLRMSIYFSKKKDCSENYSKYKGSNSTNCYSPVYSSYDFNSSSYMEFFNRPYMKNQLYKSDEKIAAASSNIEEYIIYGGPKTLNYVSTYADLLLFYDDTFKGFMTENFKVDNHFIYGKYGIYDGVYSIDIFLSLSFINKKVFEDIITILSAAELFDPQKTKAFLLDGVIYNFQTTTYFYVYFVRRYSYLTTFQLYEFSASGGILAPSIGIIPFSPNLKMLPNGEIVFVLDIIRLIFILLMLIFTFHDFYETQKSLPESEKNILALIKIFFQPKMCSTIIITIIYITCFYIKSTYLYNDLSTMMNLDNSLGYYKLNTKEYWPIVSYFEYVITLETILIIFLFLRILFFFMEYARLSSQFSYIWSAFKRVWPFLIIVIFLKLYNAIFSNNLWGQDFKEYNDLGASMLNTLLFSIGHFHAKVFFGHEHYKIWDVIYTFQFFMVIIYFELSTFIGIYLESYRISSLCNGYSYDIRHLAKHEDEEEKSKK